MDDTLVHFALVTVTVPVFDTTLVTGVDIVVVTVRTVTTIIEVEHVVSMLDVITRVTVAPVISASTFLIDCVSTVGTPVLSFYLLELREFVRRYC
jgi:hypothetical protein